MAPSTVRHPEPGGPPRPPGLIAGPGLVALALIGQLLAPPFAGAGQFDQEIRRVTEEADAAPDLNAAVPKIGGRKPAGEAVVVPVPIIDPTLGTGAALTGLYTFGLSDNPDAPRSTIGAAAGYTDTDSWLAGIGSKVHLGDDRLRIGMLAGYGHLNLDFYGIGSDPLLSGNPIGFAVSGSFAEITGQARIFDNAYLGLTARYLGARIAAQQPIDVLPALDVDFDLLGVGPVVEYDTRDNGWWPTHGSRDVAELVYFDKSIGSDASFATFDSNLAHYWSLADDLVLAGELRGAWSSRNAPFFMYPFVSVRGFPSGQYLDRVVAQAQAELRWAAWRKLGVVAFAGIGAVAPGVTSFSRDALALGLGGGVRYRISDVDRMNVGLDLAYGDREIVIYFRVGEAF